MTNEKSLAQQSRALVHSAQFTSVGEFATYGEQATRMFTTLPLQTDEDKKAAYNLMTIPDGSIMDMIGKEIEVSNLILQPAALLDDDTGELVRMVRTILVTPDGKGYVCSSKGILGDLAKIETFWGPAPWFPAIKVTIRQVPHKGKWRLFKLEVM